MVHKLIKLTEEDLHEIIKDSLNKIIENTNSKQVTEDIFLNKFLSTLTTEKQKKLCVDYGCSMTQVSYNNPLSIMMQGVVNEGTIRTYPIEKTIQYVKDHFALEDDQITKVNGINGVDVIKIAIPNVGRNLEIVKKAFLLCGYYMATPKEENIEENQWVALQFEPITQEDISTQLRKEEKILYHWAPAFCLDKIKNIGLSPRSKNSSFDYPGRVYLIRGSVSKMELYYIGNQLYENNTSPGNDGIYALLSVDLDKIPKNTKFFKGPNYSHGIYTYSNIRPDVITIIGKFSISN